MPDIDLAVTLRFIFVSAPFWLTILLISVFFHTWLNYKRREFIREKGNVLLEIRLPKDIQKTPAAMEMALEGMWEDVPGTNPDVYLKGAVRNWFSLEIVSIGGEVKFFIWTRTDWRKILESRIYAQYPGVEIHEVEDYALDIIFDPTKTKIGGITTKLSKEDAIPIKTYIDFGLDKTDKEQEQIVDPLVPVLEYLGSRQPGEIAAMQILIQAHRGMGKQDAKLIPKEHFTKGVKDAIKKIVETEAYFEHREGFPASTLNLTKTQGEAIASIERNAGKHAYDTMVRLFYAAPIEIADKMSTAGLVGSMRQFSYVGSNNVLNGIRPDKFMGFEFSWQDPFGIKSSRNQREHLDAYKRRSFFNVPYKHLMGKPYVLTIEELATLFHFPGLAATTPTLARVPSKKAEAPANLPI
ncbi:MAG: hypothetical protein A2832_00090 [Candidatus Zambryskibacteria bacterium RIFCSPHIGHO2_01_FULL_44_22b]|uniref:Uncharacterized protein n=2 Tax=Candidatus Zambryskiibacteriota TaxID=1817925 RepID=A0A1G2T096_9BACT|nr:MAG: hypothetical protein A2832_00090 [Candidatus Zambryskibacteria bacterium RIFCSPHIGHO2_01_FULL_44_22b]OHB04951.1 MAG: hypothetical protein A3B16_00055 [Candidatus Zambryskibacteria bacterium RIFCSPLOWO2_01_FULL_45_43]